MAWVAAGVWPGVRKVDLFAPARLVGSFAYLAPRARVFRDVSCGMDNYEKYTLQYVDLAAVPFFNGSLTRFWSING